MKYLRAITSISLLLACLTTIAVCYFAGHPLRAYLTENSDLLYLPALFSDVIEKHGRLSDWYLTPAPYFFPDFPLYLVAHLLGQSAYVRIAWFAVGQTVVTFGALWFLAREAVSSDALAKAVSITLAMVWLGLSAGEPFVILFASASHYGSSISALLLSALWILYKRTSERPMQKVIMVILCALTLVSTLSDNFFIVQGLIPFSATAILLDLRSPEAKTSPVFFLLHVVLWLGVALAIPALVYRLPISPPVINVAWSPSVNDEERTALETRFQLFEGDFKGGQLWSYNLADVSSDNVSALVQHPSVSDTHHINRRSFAVDGATGRFERAVSTLPAGLAFSTFIVVGVIFARGAWRNLRQRPFRWRVAAVALPVLCGLLGSLTYNYVVSNPTRYAMSVGITKTYGNVTDLQTLIQRITTATPIYEVVIVAYLGLLIVTLWALLNPFKLSLPRPLVWLTVFSGFSICASFLAASLLRDFPVMPRYLTAAYAWPVTVLGLTLGHFLGRRAFLAASAFSILSVLALGGSALNLAKENGLSTRLYPSEISCIDSALDQENLTSGIAQYWEAKHLQMFSRLDLNVAQYLEDLEEMRWITSGKYFRATYDFAIVSEDAEPTYKISADALFRLNGAPTKVVPCGSQSVYVYGKDRLRTSPSP
ncbi:MAG: hypothetical protein ABL986_14280 [Vicinamibacterales bacterium]